MRREVWLCARRARGEGRSWLAQVALPVLACVAILLSGPADAHHRRAGSDNSGVSIPNLTHGQLRVMTQYHSRILHLASRQVQPNMEVRTLQNFINLQFAYCLWGVVPGSLANEDSPFNECSHAYLAASKALLDRLRHGGETREEAETLSQNISLAMLQTASAFEICANGIEPFNTAEIIMPEWGGVSFDPLKVLLGFFVVCASAGTFAAARSRRGAAA